MNTKTLAVVALVVVVGIGSFFAGKHMAAGSAASRGQFGQGQFGNRTGQGSARGGFTNGEVISKDASGVTVKLQDGSTKIILFASSTQILKAAPATQEDISSGENVMISGTTNTDGSLTAQTVQIRPAGMSGGRAIPPQTN